jgi:hypothetical protein
MYYIYVCSTSTFTSIPRIYLGIPKSAYRVDIEAIYYLLRTLGMYICGCVRGTLLYMGMAIGRTADGADGQTGATVPNSLMEITADVFNV